MQKMLKHSSLKRLMLSLAHQGKSSWVWIKSFRCFAKAFVRNPRTVGAICPSGTQLAKLMASLIPKGEGLIVEIGAGTGAITQAILASGVAEERLLLVERSSELCCTLRRKFPNLKVVEGDAVTLTHYLPPETPVVAVISSLPLMNLERRLRALILGQIRLVVGISGCVIQYTYAVWGTSPYVKAGFYREVYRLAGWNMPPAKVECFRCDAITEQTQVENESFIDQR